MPIVVTCPGCPTKLSAPDSAAGKQIRCPKCGATAPVPNLIPAEAVEEEVVEAKVASAKPKPKPVQAEAADDDDYGLPRKKASRRDEDDDEPPRKKKRRYDDDDDYAHDHPRQRRRSGGGGGNGGKIAAIIIVGVLVLAGIGVGVYFLTGKGSLLAKKAPVPKGWKQHTFPEEGLTMYAPQKPARTGLNLTRTPADRGRQVGLFGGGRDDFDELELLSSFTSGNLNEVHVEIAVIRFRDRVPASARDRVEDVLPEQFRGAQMRSIRWLGASGQEWTRQGWVVRVVCTGRYIVLAAIRGPNDTRVTPEEEDGFFDNFELTK